MSKGKSKVALTDSVDRAAGLAVMAQPECTYGLRARKTLNKRDYGGNLSSEELSLPAARATIGAGLRPGALTKAERVLFSSCSRDYLDIRCHAEHILNA